MRVKLETKVTGRFIRPNVLIIHLSGSSRALVEDKNLKLFTPVEIKDNKLRVPFALNISDFHDAFIINSPSHIWMIFSQRQAS